jgi:hypothetical protein
MEARRLDAGRELLDHQLVDRDGLLCGNVDDVELEVPDDGGLPVVTALLAGPGVLAERFGGRVGHAWAELQRRLHPGDDDVGRIPMRSVTDIGSAITLSVAREDVDADRFEVWFRDKVIQRLPGADRAPE